MKYKNLTPHVVRLNDGTEIAPSGQLARVQAAYTPFDEDLLAEVRFADVVGLPEDGDVDFDTIYIVSAVVAQAIRANKMSWDGGITVAAPATGHPDCVRKDGQVYSVPGFVRA